MPKTPNPDHYYGEDDLTPVDTIESLRGRLDSVLADLSSADRERALKLLLNWIACGVEGRALITWQSHVLSQMYNEKR